MRLVIDANLSPTVAEALRDAGYEASHVADHGLLSATDETILDWADEHSAVVVTADSDFSMSLALRKVSSPSVVHLRGIADLANDMHAALLIDNLKAIGEALEGGAIASLSPTHLRVRDLPIR